ncbi:MAG TPA: FGGY family carbohydrate kinase [Ilumatobacteraceae bacterium]|nr:FGGY family carbohydrate kinase [Ilumatobacteraceae bacterium]
MHNTDRGHDLAGDLYCGVDVGTQGSKAGLYDVAGRCVGEGYAEHHFDNLRPGWVEMDPEQIVAATVTAIATAVAHSGVDGHRVRAIALSGILCGPVFVDDDWNPVRPLIPYLDVRASDEVAWLANEVEPRWVTESANAALDTYVMPAVYEWVRRHDPGAHARIRKVLSLAPFVGGRLAGLRAAQAYTDPSHLSGWIIGWNASTGRPSEQQMADLGIPVEHAPQVHAPWDIVGELTRTMAERTGLAPGTPIAAGAGDVMQSNLGAGLTRPGMATDVAGTASILTVGVTEPNPAITAVPGMLYSLSTLPGQALYWGYVKAGGMSLRWMRDEVLGRLGDDSLYVQGDRAAAHVPPGSGGVLFAPYLSGGNPDNPDASGLWLGMSMDTDLGVLWRSMLESIAFEYADFLDVFAANGAGVAEVIAVGGGARSPLWNQIKADVVGMPWRVPTRQDGAVLANAALAALAVGAIDDLAGTVSAWVQAGEAHVPDAATHALYRRVRTARTDLLAGPLRQVFSTLAPLRTLASPQE